MLIFLFFLFIFIIILFGIGCINSIECPALIIKYFLYWNSLKYIQKYFESKIFWSNFIKSFESSCARNPIPRITKTLVKGVFLPHLLFNKNII